MKKTPLPAEELNKGYKDYYILLESSLLGQKFDIIKCISTREGWTSIIKANGDTHHFAASIKYGLEEKWFVPFSHVEYAKLHTQAAFKAVNDGMTDYQQIGLVKCHWNFNSMTHSQQIGFMEILTSIVARVISLSSNPH